MELKGVARMHYLSAALALIVSAWALPVGAWGPIGHRVSAEIAARNISGETRAQIALILGSETLADASTVPDEQRQNPDPFWQETASPYHYVTLPGGRRVDQLEHPPEGDALTALERFTATLRDPAASLEAKQLALRFIVHIVADLHMPLHVGNGGDRGGNDMRVIWFGEPQTLHWVWDEGLVVRKQLSSTEYAERLARRTTPEQVIAWWDPRPATWMQESADLRDRIYPQTGEEQGQGTQGSPVTLDWQYDYDWSPAMELRLKQSGVRLAAYLRWVFADVPAPG